MAWLALNRPDRVRIWSAQLAANDFPPVCAVTGRPTETWRKFKFSTLPTWAYAFLLLLCTGVGFLIVALVMYVVTRRATGYLPLTRESSRRIAIATWVPIGMILGFFGLWVVAAIVYIFVNNEAASTVAAVLLSVGLLMFVAGIIGRLVITPLVGPRALVMEQVPGQYDRLVELRHLHPGFVAAVNAMHQQRPAHYAAQFTQAPSPPQLPGSN